MDLQEIKIALESGMDIEVIHKYHKKTITCSECLDTDKRAYKQNFIIKNEKL
ncbi:hypothetical protein M0R04_13305 [Candidatus Dojkabacteria bacterium]|jgi:hypothetical protein|nr:hypothetical protein [Candidatus Dojkabacteria bacterium]